jgi:hypothetical protein
MRNAAPRSSVRMTVEIRSRRIIFVPCYRPVQSMASSHFVPRGSVPRTPMRMPRAHVERAGMFPRGAGPAVRGPISQRDSHGVPLGRRASQLE